MELFAIVSEATGEILWAKLTDPGHAEQAAITAAVNRGNVRLLSGIELGEFLIETAS